MKQIKFAFNTDRRFFLKLFAFISAAFISYIFIASATSTEDITFPVKELNNCKSEKDCRAYCEKPENILPCVAFAEKHNLISKEEATKARNFAKAGKGPGNCTSEKSCEAYCNNIDHIDECLAFAENNGLMPPDEMEEARKVQQALKKGAKLPGGCKSKAECETYCEKPERMEECITFAQAAGFMPPEELDEAKKALEAIKKGAKAPPCRGRKQCDEYCSQPENMEQCLAFAEAAGFIPPDELSEAKKALQAIKKGVKPPPCRGKAECDIYCAKPENLQMCVNFAEAAGFMSPEEAARVRKTGGTGPGGCRGEKECDLFCQDPKNQEVCFEFGKEHGLIPEEDLQEIEEGKQRIQEFFEEAEPEVIECLGKRLGNDYINRLKAGTAMPRDISKDINACMRSIKEEMGSEEMSEEMPEEGSFESMPKPSGENMPNSLQEQEEEQFFDEEMMPEDIESEPQSFRNPLLWLFSTMLGFR